MRPRTAVRGASLPELVDIAVHYNACLACFDTTIPGGPSSSIKWLTTPGAQVLALRRPPLLLGTRPCHLTDCTAGASGPVMLN